MGELTTISGVRGYIDENGTAQLNLEDVVRGLGFTETAKSGNETIRWRTIVPYLIELKAIATSCDAIIPTFIPENIFYRLAMKAKNETAEVFQAKVADEILPAIRKTGTYALPQMTQAQIIAAIAQQHADQEQRLLQQSKRLKAVENRVEFVKETIVQRDDNWRETINRMVNTIVQHTADKSYQDTRNETYKLLEQRAGCDLAARVRNLKQRLEEGGATKSKVNAVTKMDVIEVDKRLKEIYTAVVKEMTIRYVA